MRKVFVVLFTMLLVAISWGQDWQRFGAQEFHQQEAEYKNKIARTILKYGKYGTENQTAFDVGYYKLQLKMDPSTEMITGSVTIRAKALVDNFQNVELNFHQAMHVGLITSHEQGPLNFVHEDHILNIQLPQVLSTGEDFELKIEYYGSPVQSGFGAFSFDSYGGQPMIWSLSEPFGARNWWPCKDVPADKADSVDVVITVPKNLIVASNGTLRSETESEGWKTYWWHESYPIVTYLVSVAIYPYEVIRDYYVTVDGDSMPVVNYVFPNYLNTAKRELPNLIRMIEILSGLYGQYPFLQEKYGEAQFLWGGGMEHQTITSLGGFGEELVVHELAHQWWGDMVTCETFHDIWLNEGFATYSEALYYEQLYGKFRYHQHMNSMQYFGGGTIYVYDLEHDPIFHGGRSYNKGSWVLHMLRHVVGDSTFFKIMRTYYTRFQYSTASTEDFRQVCEELSGMDLQRFFRQWIYEPGFPTYLFTWNSRQNENGTFTVDGVLDQSRDGTIFWMPVDVTIHTASFDTTIVVMADDDTNSFHCTVSARPLEVIVDKDNWVLNQVEEVSAPELVFAGIKLAETTGNGDNILDGGESFAIYPLFSNRGIRAVDVTATLTTADVDVQITKETITYGDIPTSSVPVEGIEPLEITIRNDATPHRSILTLKVESQNTGTHFYNFTIPIGRPDILYISAENNSYESFFTQSALDSAAIYAGQINILNQDIPVVESLLSEKVIIYNTGGNNNQVIADSVIAILQDYIDRGGKLLIAGQNLASYLNQSATGRGFLSDYLGATFQEESFTGMFIKGITDLDMTKSVFIRLLDDQNQKTQSSPDVIAPVGDAVPIMQYVPGSKIAGVRLEKGDARIVFLAFGLEAINRNGMDKSTLLLSNSIQWLTGQEVSVAQNQGAARPAEYRLDPCFPNPFNPSTRISFELPVRERTIVNIYNTRGQLIRTLTNRIFTQGKHRLLWDGKDNAGEAVASGLYFVRITAGDFVASRKAIKLQ